MRNSKNTNLKTKAYNKIRSMILLRELRQGEKIFEHDLAEQMGMSRTPVREALLILEQEKFVVNQDRLGFIVRRPTDEEITDYFTIREVLEQLAAPLMAANITDEEIKTLQNNVAAAQAYYAAGDMENFHLSNGRFLELVFEASHSSLYFRMISNLNDITYLLRTMLQKDQAIMMQSVEGHKKIVKVLETRDAEAIGKALSAHLREFREELARFVLV